MCVHYAYDERDRRTDGSKAGNYRYRCDGIHKTGRNHTGRFYAAIRKKYPEQLLMADCSIVEEALHADRLGFDFIGTTLVGYTKQSKGDKIETNDFEIIRTILNKAKHPVIAEGNINTPEKARRVIELGCYSVVVGSIITRPQLITKSFTEEIAKLEKLG